MEWWSRVAILRIEGFSIQHWPKEAPPAIQETDRRDLGKIRLGRQSQLLVQRAKGADELICTVHYDARKEQHMIVYEVVLQYIPLLVAFAIVTPSHKVSNGRRCALPARHVSSYHFVFLIHVCPVTTSAQLFRSSQC